LQSGSSAAKTILADRARKSAKPFKYLDKGTMAMIGRGAAVAQVKGIELHGKAAFAAWLGVHAALMTGGSNRVDAFKSWAQDFFGADRAPQALDRSGTPRMTWDEDEVDEPAAVTA
jgi:NADH dehydrogenase